MQEQDRFAPVPAHGIRRSASSIAALLVIAGFVPDAVLASNGLQAAGGDAITVDGELSIVLPNGPGNHGVLAEDPGTTVTLNGPTRITMGKGGVYSPGMLASRGAAIIANGDLTISTAGDSRSDAAAANGGSTVTLNGALNLSTSGLQASALKVTTEANIGYNGQATFDISGVNGSGIRAVTGGHVTAAPSSVTTINVTGVNGQGVSSRDVGSQVNVAGSLLINLSGATQANQPNGNPESYAAGLLADAGGVIGTTGKLQVNTTDATSFGALLAGNNATMAASGGGTINAAGVALGFVSGTEQQARFDGFTISSAAGDLIHVDGVTGGSTLMLSNSAASSAAGGALLSVTNASTFTLIASHSTLGGDISADAGSALNVRLAEASTLAGSVHGATLDIGGASAWTMTADSTLSGLSLAGRIAFQSADAAFVPKTLTVSGNWVGAGGTVQLRTSLGDSGSATDRIVIDGGAVSGHTTLQIANVGGLGAATSGDGIEVVKAVNGATTTAQDSKDAFSLAGGHVDAGAYAYRLHAGDAAGAGESWYLRSSYRPEVPLLAALPMELRQSDLAMLGNLHQRVGDKTGSDGGRRAWARAIHSDLDIRQAGDVAPHSRGHVGGLQAGADLLASGPWHAGVFVGTLDGSADQRGDTDGAIERVGRNDLQSRHLGGYATCTDADGLYADAVVQLGSHRYSVQPDEASATAGRARSVTASLEAGKLFHLDTGWDLEPQAQLVYQKSRFDNVSISAAEVQQQAPGQWTGRLGVRLKGEIATAAGPLMPYARLNLYRTRGGADMTAFVEPAATARIASGSGSDAAELALGFTLAPDATTSVYGEVGRVVATGGDARVGSQVQGTVGVKMRW